MSEARAAVVGTGQKMDPLLMLEQAATAALGRITASDQEPCSWNYDILIKLLDKHQQIKDGQSTTALMKEVHDRLKSFEERLARVEASVTFSGQKRA